MARIKIKKITSETSLNKDFIPLIYKYPLMAAFHSTIRGCLLLSVFYRFCTPANGEIVMLMMTVMLDWALPFH